MATKTSTEDLLAAMLDALSIPEPATWRDEEQHDRVLKWRARAVRIALDGVLHRGHAVDGAVGFIREKIAEVRPDGYEHRKPELDEAVNSGG